MEQQQGSELERLKVNLILSENRLSKVFKIKRDAEELYIKVKEEYNDTFNRYKKLMEVEELCEELQKGFSEGVVESEKK